MKIYTILDEYGFWDPPGRNRFYKFPKFSFIDIKYESELAGDHFIIDEQNSEILSEKALAEMLNTSKRKAYIRFSNNFRSKIYLIVEELTGYLLRYGKYVAGDSKTCSTVKLFDEIMIGVKNPKLQKEILLKILKQNRSLSKFSLIRPLESYDD